MNLKHPNDPAVAWLLKAFEKELRDGYHFPGSAENVFEQLKRIDDEAEAQHQATLRKKAEEAWRAWNLELEKRRAEREDAERRAEKQALFGPRYSTGAIVGCSICSHITLPTVTVKSEAELRLARARDNLIAAVRNPKAVGSSNMCGACGGGWSPGGAAYHAPFCPLVELREAEKACKHKAESRESASLIVSELRRTKAVLANILADATVSEYAKHHLKYSHNRLCKAIHRFAQEGDGDV